MTEQGALWAKWDLHVHTPNSLVHGYRANSKVDVWEKFITELESLPSEFKVIGVNDYWFLEGYERLIGAKNAGRLANIDLLLPVIEMRIDAFGGTESDLSRANLHVIFDPELNSETIRAQFLSSLQARFKLSPDNENLTWNQIVTMDSLAELGKQVRESTPSGMQDDLGGDLELGFGALVVPLSDVLKKLENNSALKGKYLLALGKTEWADIKWTGQSVGTKKNLANQCDIMFTAFAAPDTWAKQRAVLTKAKVTDKLFDCSDAHHWSSSKEKDRIGNCWNWLRAETSFAGLRHALLEFDSRVYVGLEPPDLGRANAEPESIVDRISVRSQDGKSRAPFDYDLELNQRYVAVVGNKGQGKSALIDCIARAGNSSRDDFGFLNKKRFLAPKNLTKAAKFQATISWRSGEEKSALLTALFDKSQRERVEYLPQSFIERLCSADPRDAEATEFESELKSVLFTHIPEEQRRNAARFDQLLDMRTAAIDRKIHSARTRVVKLAQSYEALISEEQGTSVDELNGRLKELESALSSASSELEVKDNLLKETRRAAPKSKAISTASKKLSLLVTEQRLLTEKIQETSKQEGAVTQTIETAEDLVSQIRLAKVDLVSKSEQLSSLLEVGPGEPQLVDVQIHNDVIERTLGALRDKSASLREARIQLRSKLELLDSEVTGVKAELEKLDHALELARRQRDQVQARVDAIEGDIDDPNSLAGVRKQLKRYESLPDEIQNVRKELDQAAKDIQDCLLDRLEIVSGLYEPAAEFIADNPIASDAGIDFRADLYFGENWGLAVEDLDLRRSSDLANHMQELELSTDLHNSNTVLGELREILDRLGRERGSKNGAPKDPRDAMRSKATLSEFVARLYKLDWAELRFGLSGQGLSLRELSPGQRGLILLLFYLVVDKRNIPLLLDQPEENLDNETIKKVLVPALREASSRRQVVVVTHNANLAIVGDADQIVYCVASDKGRFSLEAASSADAALSRTTLNVLEGTSEAFLSRSRHYTAVNALE